MASEVSLSDKLRAMLDERGIEYETPTSTSTVAHIGDIKYRFLQYRRCGEPSLDENLDDKVFAETDWLTPEQAIAATVGYREQAEWDEWLEDHNGVLEWHSPRVHPPKVIELHFSDGITRFVPEDAATVGNSTDLSKRLREVHGLHAFAELFGFDWTGESDWDWHDVACAMADAVDAETAGEEHEMHICKRCGVAYELNIIDKGFGKPRFCPNCGHRRSTND